jgi:hypothetical protein
MPTIDATSATLDDRDLSSWTTGMPVHPEPARGIDRSSLPRKDLLEMVVLAGACVISTFMFVPPLAGVTRPTQERPALVARDLAVDALSVAPAVRLRAPRPAEVTAPAPVTGAALRNRSEEPRGTTRRVLTTKLRRVLAGDGRYRVRPFPRPTEFD